MNEDEGCCGQEGERMRKKKVVAVAAKENEDLKYFGGGCE